MDIDNTDKKLQEGKEALNAGSYTVAFNSLLPCAEVGNAESQAIIGFLYYVGLGVDRDLQQSINWLLRAIEQGRGDAAHNLATLYLTCEPELPRDFEKSKKFYLKAQELGFVVTSDKWYDQLK
jgi:TPR repeat protein